MPSASALETGGQYTVGDPGRPGRRHGALGGHAGPGGAGRLAASRCGSSGTVLDVTDARQQADAAAGGPAAGDGDRRGGRRAGQRRPLRGPAPRSCCAARRCWARSPALLAVFDAGGRAAAAAHDPAAWPTRSRGTSTTPSRASRSSSTTRSRRSTPPCTASGCCWPTQEEMVDPLPGDPGGQRGAGRARRRRPAAAGGGPGPRLVRRDLDGRPRVHRGRRRAARGARRADRAERLPAAGRRRARGRGRRDGRGERSGSSCWPTPGACCRGRSTSPSRSASSPSSSSRRWATGAGSSSPTSRAGCTSWPRRTGTRPAARSWRPTSSRWSR